MSVTKAYVLNYRGVEVTIKLVRNGFWRWYANTVHSVMAGDQTTINFGMGTNALTHFGAVRAVKREINENIGRLAASTQSKTTKKGKK